MSTTGLVHCSSHAGMQTNDVIIKVQQQKLSLPANRTNLLAENEARPKCFATDEIVSFYRHNGGTNCFLHQVAIRLDFEQLRHDETLPAGAPIQSVFSRSIS